MMWTESSSGAGDAVPKGLAPIQVMHERYGTRFRDRCGRCRCFLDVDRHDLRRSVCSEAQLRGLDDGTSWGERWPACGFFGLPRCFDDFGLLGAPRTRASAPGVPKVPVPPVGGEW